MDTHSRGFAISALTDDEKQREREEAEAMPVEEKKAAIALLDAEIKVLTRQRAVLSGELYTMRGRFKAMGRDYGLPFMIWWTTVWSATGLGIFATITVSRVALAWQQLPRPSHTWGERTAADRATVACYVASAVRRGGHDPGDNKYGRASRNIARRAIAADRSHGAAQFLRHCRCAV